LWTDGELARTVSNANLGWLEEQQYYLGAVSHKASPETLAAADCRNWLVASWQGEEKVL